MDQGPFIMPFYTIHVFLSIVTMQGKSFATKTIIFIYLRAKMINDAD